ncbi:MAG: MFS transporter, partial [Oscillospiraceae bacterium]
WLHSLWGVGAMTGPVLMSFFLAQGNWRRGYLCVGLMLFFMSAVLFITLPMWKKFEKTKRFSKEKEEEFANQKYSLLTAFRQRGAKTSMVAFLFYCGIEMVVGLWGSTYLINIKGLDASSASLWISFFFAGITVARAVSGCLTIRITNKVQLRVGQGIIAVGTILLLFPLSAKLAAGAIVLVGIGCAPIYPLMIHETPKRFAENSAAVMGLQIASAYCGFAFLPLAFGYFASATSFNIMPTVLLLFSVIVILCTENINRLSKNNQSIN